MFAIKRPRLIGWMSLHAHLPKWRLPKVQLPKLGLLNWVARRRNRPVTQKIPFC
jgi:hypothetical protein